MEIYAHDSIKDEKYVTELQTLIALDLNFTLSLPLTPTIPTSYPPPPTNAGPVQCFQHWQVGEGEGRKYSDIFKVNFFLTHVEQLCSSLSQTNYSMIVVFIYCYILVCNIMHKADENMLVLYG